MTDHTPSPTTPRCPRCGWWPIEVLRATEDIDTPPAERWWVYLHCGTCAARGRGVGLCATGPTAEAAEEAARQRWVVEYPPQQEPA